MLTIFRGDDLAFAEYDRKVCVRFDTFQDLTGWAAKFCLLDNIKESTDISSRLWTFGYTAEETAVFPLGKTFGKLTILDSQGQIRQMSRVEVEVVNKKLEPCIAGTIAISVDNVIADYANMGNKPSINGKTVEGVHDGSWYGLASAQDVETLSCKVDAGGHAICELTHTVQNMSATVTDQGEAIANNYLKLVGLEQKVQEIIDPDTGLSGQIAKIRADLTIETSKREQQDTVLGNAISETARALNQEVADRQEADRGIIESTTQQISDAKQEMAESMEMLCSGRYLVSRLLFESPDDDDNYYRVKVVLRDAGNGVMLPTFAFVAVPKGMTEESSEG